MLDSRGRPLSIVRMVKGEFKMFRVSGRYVAASSKLEIKTLMLQTVHPKAAGSLPDCLGTLNPKPLKRESYENHCRCLKGCHGLFEARVI